MLNKTFFFATILPLFLFASCKKESPVVSIEGDWKGKSSVLSGPYDNDFNLRIRPGGVLELTDASGHKTGAGTWAFYSNNTAISGTYSLLAPAETTFSVIAIFDKIKGKLSGTWGNGANDYDGGYWYMDKVK